MANVWDKLDAYTKSDYLNSSDEDGDLVNVIRKAENETIISENSSQSQSDECSGENGKVKGDAQQSLLKEMRENKLHCNTESRNVQGKINDIAAEKRNQKGELNEMQHKAQVISKSARMSANEVLSTITSSETMDIEENKQMGEYLNKIRTAQTEDNGTSEQSDTSKMDCDPQSSSSDLDLPDIPPASTNMLNTGMMKSKVSVVRQGSMKTRRKPTNRKSWTPGIEQLKLNEQDDTKTETTKESDIWVLPQPNDGGLTGTPPQRSGSLTPSDSSSEDEKETTKPHFKSGIALPGLWDVEKIKIQRSELKRPTASNLVKSAKDAKENEVTREDKTEVVPPKPAWMNEVEQRRKTPKPARRKHVTLPARCSELDKLFEQRTNDRDLEGLADTSQSGQDAGGTAKEEPRSGANDKIDPQLSKLLEKRRNLTPMEGVEFQTQPRPKSLQFEEVSELDKIFEKRKNLKPLEGIGPEPDQSTSGPGRPVLPHGEDKTDPGIVRARLHDSRSGKLEPLSVTGDVKVATISELNSDHGHVNKPAQVGQVVQFAYDGKGGDRAKVSRIPPSGNQTRVSVPASNHSQTAQASQVAEFVFDGKGGTRAMVGRIPPAAAATDDQRPLSRLGHNVDHRAMLVKYEDQSRGEHVVVQSRSSHGENLPTTTTTVRAFNHDTISNAVHQPRTPSRSSRGVPTEPSRSDPGAFANQLSSKPAYRQENSQGKSRPNSRTYHRARSVERFEPRRVIPNTKRHSAGDARYNTPNTNPLPNHTPRQNPGDQTRSPRSHPSTHDQTLPPQKPGRVRPQYHTTPHGTHTPEVQYYSQRPHNSDRANEKSYSKTPPESHARAGKVTSPVDTPVSRYRETSDLYTAPEKNRLTNVAYENDVNRVKNTIRLQDVKRQRSGQNESGLRRPSDQYPKPVTVTVRSVTESPVRVQTRNNGSSDRTREGNTLSPITNSEVPRRRAEGRLTNGNIDPQGSQSTTPEIPKWKQELREKKRLQGDRQKNISHDKENIKAERPESDVAEWQKRLKGIRQKWGEETGDKDNKDNNDNVQVASEPGDENDKEVPGFLKEFQAKKMKQKIVTVAATSTPSENDRDRTNEDRKSSSKQELGTYV